MAQKPNVPPMFTKEELEILNKLYPLPIYTTSNKVEIDPKTGRIPSSEGLTDGYGGRLVTAPKVKSTTIVVKTISLVGSVPKLPISIGKREGVQKLNSTCKAGNKEKKRVEAIQQACREKRAAMKMNDSV
jgi:hypothetical protein